ncbi:MAG: YicC family protein [Proteobacteria bacterium]|nr:MAG: YicC family protein [Pseudomonadota bacterium]
MIRSMTAFARSDRVTANGSLTWEVRTVNHRYLETTLRLPDGFRSQENDYKELVRTRLARGKLDAVLRFDPEGAEQATTLNIDTNRVGALLNAQQQIQSLSQEAGNLSVSDILSWPGVVKPEVLDFDGLYKDAMELLGEALNDLVEARRREGKRLVMFIEHRCDQIEQIVVAVTERREVVVQASRERLMQRIESLDLEVDPQRLEQELAIQAQRLDVSEELDRLGAHIDELRQTLTGGQAVGRRLDFLMQEFNREANTLGSKSNDAETTRHSMELKVLIEQMREQIQNIE